MKTSRVVICFLATLSFFVTSALPQQESVFSLTQHAMTTSSARPTLKVAVYAFPELDRSVVFSAEKVTTEIFKQSSIEVEWLNCPRTQPCDQPAEGPQFRVAIHPQIGDIAKDSAQVKLMSEHDSLGFAIPCALTDTVCLAYIFYFPISRLALTEGASVAVILGHVIAHEIGHALLGPNAHSHAGIMVSKLPIANLERFLCFTSQESKRITANLVARSQQQRTSCGPASRSDISFNCPNPPLQ